MDKTLLITAALSLAGFFVAAKVVSSFAPRPLATLIKIIMLLMLGSYLYRAESARFAELFSKIKEESGAAQKAIDFRGEKIRKQTE